MRPGLGGYPRIAEHARFRADYAVNASSGAPQLLSMVGVEVVESGLYRIGCHVAFQAPGNNANNELSLVLYVDDHFVVGRSNDGSFNNTVPTRATVDRDWIVYLAEGGHQVTLRAHTVGTDGFVLSNYGEDMEILYVDRL